MNRALARLVGQSPFPIYVLDDQRRIIYGNSAFFAWTCCEPDQLFEARCDYHSSPEVGLVRGIAAGLCPPPEAFQGQRVPAEVSCRTTSGQLSRRRAAMLPLGDDEMHIVGVVVFVDSVEAPTDNWDQHTWSTPGPAELHHQLMLLRRRISPRFGIDRLVGESHLIRRVRAQVRMALDARPRAVVIGPKGSGREHVARTIHYGDDPIAAGRLVPISCPLMDAELLQATITNVKRHSARHEDRQPTTFLLLDVDQLSEASQHELAGFLSLPGFQLHTLSTARHSLFQLAAEGRFHKELGYLLSTLVIELPSLAARRDDVPLLAQVFLEQQNAAGGRQFSGFSHEALDQLASYDWPGNVDELAEIVQEAYRRAEGPLVNAADLPAKIRFAADATAYPRPVDEAIVLDEFLAKVESELIGRAMQRAKGNKTKAAQLLGMTRARFHRRLEQLSCELAEDDVN